jgi:hypothetical protein
LADDEIVRLLRADTRPHDNWFRDIGLNRTGFDGADGPTRSIRQSGIPSLPVRFDSATPLAATRFAHRSGIPYRCGCRVTTMRRRRYLSVRAATAHSRAPGYLVGLSLCRRGSNQISCCCQRGWCTELHIGQGGEFPVRGRDRWLHHASTCRADGGGRP